QGLRTANGSALLARFTVATLPSAATVAFLRPARLDRTRMFIGAIGRAVGAGWPVLPGTVREARAVARLFPGAQVAIEKEFTAGRVIAALGHDSIVHLATHGDLDDQAPIFSALITAPTSGDGGRVPLHRLMETRIDADLVV